jgi:hypothetical protein
VNARPALVLDALPLSALTLSLAHLAHLYRLLLVPSQMYSARLSTNLIHKLDLCLLLRHHSVYNLIKNVKIINVLILTISIYILEMTNNISKLATNINVRLNALLKKTKKNNTKTNDNRWRKYYNDDEKKYYYSSLSKPLSVWELPPGGIVNYSPTKEYIVAKSGDWEKIEDINGRSWYYNPKLKEYDWEKPAGLVFTNVNPKEEVYNLIEPEPNTTKRNNVLKNNTKKNNPTNNIPKNNVTKTNLPKNNVTKTNVPKNNTPKNNAAKPNAAKNNTPKNNAAKPNATKNNAANPNAAKNNKPKNNAN